MGTERAKRLAKGMFNRHAARYEATFAGRHSARMKKAALACLEGPNPNPKRALSEFHRVLKPDGQLVLADPTAPSPVRGVLNCVVRLLRVGDMRMYDQRDLTSLFDACRFQWIDWRHEGWWGFVASARSLARSS